MHSFLKFFTPDQNVFFWVFGLGLPYKHATVDTKYSFSLTNIALTNLEMNHHCHRKIGPEII